MNVPPPCIHNVMWHSEQNLMGTVQCCLLQTLH